ICTNLTRVCFFFQAEDGIRDLYVTGVQTCALPISRLAPVNSKVRRGVFGMSISYGAAASSWIEQRPGPRRGRSAPPKFQTVVERSEERRVGKGFRFRWG